MIVGDRLIEKRTGHNPNYETRLVSLSIKKQVDEDIMRKKRDISIQRALICIHTHRYTSGHVSTETKARNTRRQGEITGVQVSPMSQGSDQALNAT